MAKQVPLLLGGKSFNGQMVSVGEWENHDSFFMAKAEADGDYFLWAGCGWTDQYKWLIETKEGERIAEGTYEPQNEVGSFEGTWKAIEQAQKLADKYFEDNLK